MSEYTILGVTGFIGGHVARYLQAQGHSVYCPTRSELPLLKSATHIIHALGGDDWRSPDALDGHFGHLSRILTQCRYESLTYLSSTRVYLNAVSGNETAQLVISQRDKGGFYNLLKLMGENICLQHPRTRVVRLSNVTGYNPNGIALIPSLIRNATTSGKITLSLHPRSAKDYISINDIPPMLLKIINGKERLYNLASGHNTMTEEIVAQIQKETGCSVYWSKPSESPIFPPISIKRIQEEFGFEPSYIKIKGCVLNETDNSVLTG